MFRTLKVLLQKLLCLHRIRKTPNERRRNLVSLQLNENPVARKRKIPPPSLLQRTIGQMSWCERNLHSMWTRRRRRSHWRPSTTCARGRTCRATSASSLSSSCLTTAPTLAGRPPLTLIRILSSHLVNSHIVQLLLLRTRSRNPRNETKPNCHKACKYHPGKRAQVSIL